MKFHHSVIDTPQMFDKISRSIMFGYGLGVPDQDTKAVMRLSDHTINVIVIGATEDAAEQRVRNCFKGQQPDNIACFGADSDLNATQKILTQYSFSGHVIFCPEVSYLREMSFELFSQLIHMLGKHVDRHGSGCEMHVLMPSREILENLLGALFEIWKSARPQHWFFYDERNRFSRSYITSALNLEKRNRNLGFEGEFEVVLGEGEAKLSAPWILDPAKTFASYSNPREEFDRSMLHAIRLGEDFARFAPHVIRNMLDDLQSYQSVDRVGSDRDICIHDVVAWKLFTDNIRPHLPYYNDGPDHATCGGDGKKMPKKRIIQMEEISK